MTTPTSGASGLEGIGTGISVHMTRSPQNENIFTCPRCYGNKLATVLQCHLCDQRDYAAAHPVPFESTWEKAKFLEEDNAKLKAALFIANAIAEERWRDAERFRALVQADKIVAPCKPPLRDGGFYAEISGDFGKSGVFGNTLTELADIILGNPDRLEKSEEGK